MRVGISTRLLRNLALPAAFEWIDRGRWDSVTLDYESHVEGKFEESNEAVANEILETVENKDVSLEALAAFGNPLHPDETRANRADERLRNAIELAAELDVETVSCFSGLPGASASAEHPNWITVLWPCEMEDAHDYQWEIAKEYWTDVMAHAADHGVDVSVEMHPNNLVYEPTGLLELREATNDRLHAIVNPANICWMNISPAETIRFLSESKTVKFVKAKDVEFREEQLNRKGVLDPTVIHDEDRSWTFKTVGYGQDRDWWTELLSAATESNWIGYVEIEQEDPDVSPAEGIEHGTKFLRSLDVS